MSRPVAFSRPACSCSQQCGRDSVSTPVLCISRMLFRAAAANSCFRLMFASTAFLNDFSRFGFPIKGSTHSLVHLFLLALGRFADAAELLLPIHSCSRALALLDVPNWTRAAIRLIDNVVSWRRRAARGNLPGSLLRPLSKSAFVQPIRFNSSFTILSALVSAISRRSVREW